MDNDRHLEDRSEILSRHLPAIGVRQSEGVDSDRSVKVHHDLLGIRRPLIPGAGNKNQSRRRYFGKPFFIMAPTAVRHAGCRLTIHQDPDP